MDRRHFVLAIAVLAVVGDERELPPLYEGHEVLHAGLFEIEGHDATTWIVKAEVDMPPGSEDTEIWSWLHVLVAVDAAATEPRFVLAARTCGNASTHDEVRVPAEEDTGEEDTGAPAYYDLAVGGLFDGCPPEEPCERAVCVDASNEAGAVLTLAVEIQAFVESEETVEYSNDETIEVPIALSFAEEGG